MHYHRDRAAIGRYLPSLLLSASTLDEEARAHQRAMCWGEMDFLFPLRNQWTPFDRERFYELELRHLVLSILSVIETGSEISEKDKGVHRA